MLGGQLESQIQKKFLNAVGIGAILAPALARPSDCEGDARSLMRWRHMQQVW
jgi:hypothetical protein